MSARPLLIMTCLTLFGLSTTRGCGGEEEPEEDAPAAKAGKARKGGKRGNRNNESSGSDGMTGQSELTIRTLDPEEDVVPLGEPAVVTDPGSMLDGACELLIDCVCNLETARHAANPEEATNPDCVATQQVFTDRPDLDGVCHERLRIYQGLIEDNNQFEDEGISIPSSCL